VTEEIPVVSTLVCDSRVLACSIGHRKLNQINSLLTYLHRPLLITSPASRKRCCSSTTLVRPESVDAAAVVGAAALAFFKILGGSHPLVTNDTSGGLVVLDGLLADQSLQSELFFGLTELLHQARDHINVEKKSSDLSILLIIFALIFLALSIHFFDI